MILGVQHERIAEIPAKPVEQHTCTPQPSRMRTWCEPAASLSYGRAPPAPYQRVWGYERHREILAANKSGPELIMYGSLPLNGVMKIPIFAIRTCLHALFFDRALP